MNLARQIGKLAAASSLEDILAHGRWRAEGREPVTCLDPAKLRHMLGFQPSNDLGNVIPFSHVKSLERKFGWKKIQKLFVGGDLMFADEFSNIVVNEGLNHLLGVTLASVAQDTTWFIGLIDGTPTIAAGNTMASHSPWTERTEYSSPAARSAFVPGSVASQSVSNSASPSAFTINATITVGGAFLNASSTGTSGILYAAGAFTAGNKTLNSADTLSVTATFTATG